LLQPDWPSWSFSSAALFPGCPFFFWLLAKGKSIIIGNRFHMVFTVRISGYWPQKSPANPGEAGDRIPPPDWPISVPGTGYQSLIVMISYRILLQLRPFLGDSGGFFGYYELFGGSRGVVLGGFERFWAFEAFFGWFRTPELVLRALYGLLI